MLPKYSMLRCKRAVYFSFKLVSMTYTIFSFCSSAYASLQAPVVEAPYETHQVLKGPSISGESWDLRTGAVSWEVPDVLIPGKQGLDLLLTRTYQKGGVGPQAFASWELSIPRVVFSGNPYGQVDATSDPNLSYCDAPTTPAYTAGATVSAHAFETGIQLVIPGEGARYLVEKLDTDTRFPSDAKYVTNDNWFAKCTSAGEFHIFSPDGRQFIIGAYHRILGAWWQPVAIDPPKEGTIVGYATAMSNQYGEYYRFVYDEGSYQTNISGEWNYLFFNFQTSATSFQSIKSVKPNIQITPPAGGIAAHRPYLTSVYRELPKSVLPGLPNYQTEKVVELTYKANYIGGVGNPVTGGYPVIESIKLFPGTPSEQEILYDYGDLKIASSYCHFIENSSERTKCQNQSVLSSDYLESATYADGTVSTYTYGGPIVNAIFDGYSIGSWLTGLTSIVSRTGIKLDYSYVNLFNCTFDTDYCSGGSKGNTPFPSVSSRVVTDQITGDVYNYSVGFSNAAGKLVSTLTKPSGVITTKYERSHLSTIFARVLEQDIAGKRSVAYTYGNEFQVGKNTLNSPLYSRYSVSLTEASIDSGKYRQVFSNFNIYAAPQTVIEYGVDGENVWDRTIDLTYNHTIKEDSALAGMVGCGPLSTVSSLAARLPRFNGYVLNQLEKKLVDGKSVFEASFVHNGVRTEIRNRGDKTVYNREDSNISLAQAMNPQSTVCRPMQFLTAKKNIDGVDRVTTVNWHSLGRPSSVGYPDGTSMTNTYNEFGDLISSTDARGYTTSYSFDSARRVIGINLPDDTQIRDDVLVNWLSPFLKEETRGVTKTKTFYDGFGRVSKVQLFRAGTLFSVIDTVYDSEGNVIWQGAPGQVNQAYNEAGQRIGDIVSYKYGVKKTYDALNRLVETLRVGRDGQNGGVETRCYDGDCSSQGFPVAAAWRGVGVVDAKGNKSYIDAVGIGTPAQVAQGDVFEQKANLQWRNTQVDRDKLLSLIRVNRGGLERSYTYDGYGRLSSEIAPEYGSRTFVYDDSNNNISITYSGGRTVTFSFDAMSRIQSKVTSEGGSGLLVSYGYDANGNLQSVSDNGVSVVYTHNAISNVSSKTLSIDSLSFVLSYQYDSLDRVASVIYPSGKSVPYVYDEASNLLSVGTYAVASDYLSDGQYQSLQLGDGSSHEYAFNEFGLLGKANYKAQNGVGFFDASYSYDNLDNLIDLDHGIHKSKSRVLNYDAFSRLVSANGITESTHVYYDDSDNITRKRLTSDPADILYNYSSNKAILESVSGQISRNYTYDSLGAVVSDGASTYARDVVGRITGIGLTRSHVYLGDNYRVKTTDNGYSIYYLYGDNGKIFYTYEPMYDVKTDYVYAHNKLIAKVQQIPENDADNDTVWDYIEYENGFSNGADDRFLDNDGDGISNAIEVSNGTPPNIDQVTDSDNDGLPDYHEYLYGTDLNVQDSDSDGVFDGSDVWPLDVAAHTDTDLDGKPNDWSAACGLTCQQGSSFVIDLDDDNDTLSDSCENTYSNLNPIIYDDPTLDGDLDGLSLYEECEQGYSPLLADTDGNGVLDGDEAEYARRRFLLLLTLPAVL